MAKKNVRNMKICGQSGYKYETVPAITLKGKWLDEQFFSLAELNRAIRDKLELFNQRLFQKKEGSRRSLFLEEEKPLLAPLPATRFELSDWKTATVQFNYHISVDGMLYSVPYEYIKKKVDVKVTVICSLTFCVHFFCSKNSSYSFL